MSEANHSPQREELEALAMSLAAGNFAAIGMILQSLQGIQAFTDLPSAFLVQVRRILGQGERLSGESPDQAANVKRFLEGLLKLLKAWPAASNTPVVEETFHARDLMPREERTVLETFISGQVDRLQTLEALVLEREKGNPAAGGRIKGMLHNLKGEFGVLDMAGWSGLLHDVETAFESGFIGTDELLGLKDRLEAQLEELAKGIIKEPDAPLRRSLGLDKEIPPAPPMPSLVKPEGVPTKPKQAEKSIDPVGLRETSPVAAIPDRVVPPAPAMPEALASLPPAVVDSEPISNVSSVYDAPSTLSSVPEISEFGMELDASYLADFIQESTEHIRAIEIALLRLEVEPTAKDSLNGAFRAFHTVKGLASFLKLTRIQRLAHAAESMLDQVRRELITLKGGHVDVLLVATDCLRNAVSALESGSTAAQNSDLGDLASDLVIERLLHPESIEEAVSTFPDGNSGHTNPAPLGEMLVERGAVAAATVDLALASQSKGDARPLGEILVSDHKARALDVGQALAKQVKISNTPAPSPEKSAPDTGMTSSNAAVEDSIRVPVSRLDQLIDAIGEAVIAQSMVFADPSLRSLQDLALDKKMGQAGLMMRQIQELSMSLRMVAIRQTFQKMSRLVRDLSRKLGKQIDLEMEGETTELDKTVVENIGDPLVHMVRNSLDHGLEGPDERIASGKSPRGRITLRSYHKGGSVHIEIEDDGRGLNRERILGKAQAAGLVRPDQNLTDSEIWQLIFHPGLSTADKITDVSGRGVGMDVVKRNIEQLRGAIDIRSEVGKGTCFTIRLPLTLAIIGGMVVRVGHERYIVPTLSVHATLRFDPANITTVVGRGELLDLRGELIRLVRLRNLFEIHTVTEITDGVVLVVEDSFGRRTGLVVDQILDQQQVVIKNLGGGMTHTPGLTGGAIMTDGTVSLILDVSGIVRMAYDI